LLIVHFSVASNFVLAHCFLFLPTFNPHMPSPQFMCPPSSSTIIVKSIVTIFHTRFVIHALLWTCIKRFIIAYFAQTLLGMQDLLLMHLHVLLLTLFVLLSLHCILIVFSKFMFCRHCKFVLAFKNTIQYSPPHYTCTRDNERWRRKVFLVSRIIPWCKSCMETIVF